MTALYYHLTFTPLHPGLFCFVLCCLVSLDSQIKVARPLIQMSTLVWGRAPGGGGRGLRSILDKPVDTAAAFASIVPRAQPPSCGCLIYVPSRREEICLLPCVILFVNKVVKRAVHDAVDVSRLRLMTCCCCWRGGAFLPP